MTEQSTKMTHRVSRLFFFLMFPALFSFRVEVFAEPFVSAGDSQVRHDIEYLADRGLFNVPISTWPLSWVDVAIGLEPLSATQPESVRTREVIARLRNRVDHAAKPRFGGLETSVAVSQNTPALRGFQSQPRGRTEVELDWQYTGSSFAAKIQLAAVSGTNDAKTLRLDGSYLGYVWNNISVTAGMQERWWGPGQVSSLILSNNARPVPSLTLRRQAAMPFQHPWLRWMGPWSAQVFAGRLETDRFIESPNLLGARAVIKPMRSLELGVSRTAQWGGEGRPTSFDSLVNLVFGRDNQGEGVTREEEPGNQLAGFDARYSRIVAGQAISLYGQFIGEDEAGGFPSRYLGMFGVSTSMPLERFASTLRISAEFSDTTCQFYEESRIYDCAYNSSLYRSGYRYRGRSIGASTDGDSRQMAILATLNSSENQHWSALARWGQLNRGGGEPELVNTIASESKKFLELDVFNKQPLATGALNIGLGYSQRETTSNGDSDKEFRIYVKWTSRAQ